MTAPAVPIAKVIERRDVPHQIRVCVEPGTFVLFSSCICLEQEDGSFVPLTEGESVEPAEILAAQARHEAEAKP